MAENRNKYAWIKENYSDEQIAILEAMAKMAKRVVMKAPAGSGKTHTLAGIYRVLLQARNIDPSKIAVIAFTNNAADEAKGRLVKNTPEAKDSKIKTMHSLGLELIKSFPVFKGKNIRVLSDSKLIKAAELDSYKGVSGKDLLRSIQEARERGLDVTDMKEVKKFCALHDKTTNRATEFLEGYRKYSALLERMHTGKYGNSSDIYIDMPDMILLPVKMMEEDISLRDGVRERFDAILIDEFQDMNPAQIQMFRLMLKPEAVGVVVGDDSQSIYQWRGALIDALAMMAEEWGIKIMELTMNFRSTKEIVDAANTITFPGGKTLNMRALPGRSGPVPELVVAKNEQDEIDRIAEQVRKCLEQGYKPNEIMGIARVNSKVAIMKAAFEKAGVKVASEGIGATVAEKCSRLFSWINGEEPRSVLLDMIPFNSSARPVAVKLLDENVPEEDLASRAAELAEEVAPEAADKLKRLLESPVPENMADAIKFAGNLGLFPGEKGVRGTERALAGKYWKKFSEDDGGSDLDKLNEILVSVKDDGLDTAGAAIVSTIHKMKGGQARVVILDVTNGDFPRKGKVPSVEEFNNLVVALTRAMEKMVLYADGSRGISVLMNYLSDPSKIKGLKENVYRYSIEIPKEDGPAPKSEDFVIEPEMKDAAEKIVDALSDDAITGFLSNNALLSEGSSDGKARLKDKFGIEYNSVTNAYWASTTEDVHIKKMISNMSPEEAALFGPKIERSPIEIEMMNKNARQMLRSWMMEKFRLCDTYRRQLLESGDLPTSDGKEIPGTAQFLSEFKEILVRNQKQKQKARAAEEQEKEPEKTMRYAGIGSRRIKPLSEQDLTDAQGNPRNPTDEEKNWAWINKYMQRAAAKLESMGYILQSGGAEGSDSAFAAGVSDTKNMRVVTPRNENCKGKVSYQSTQEGLDSVDKYHENPSALPDFGRKLMERDYYQVMGNPSADMKKVDFVLCWAPVKPDGTRQYFGPLRDANGNTVYERDKDGNIKYDKNGKPKPIQDPRNTGGTGQAITIAQANGIPVYNLYLKEGFKRFQKEILGLGDPKVQSQDSKPKSVTDDTPHG